MWLLLSVSAGFSGSDFKDSRTGRNFPSTFSSCVFDRIGNADAANKTVIFVCFAGLPNTLASRFAEWPGKS